MYILIVKEKFEKMSVSDAPLFALMQYSSNSNLIPAKTKLVVLLNQ